MPNTAPENPIEVAVGIIFNDNGQVLLSQRPEHVHQGGRWEFPGGKRESNETMAAALHRELAEELGIDVLAARPLLTVNHRYSDRQVVLDVWQVEHYLGEPTGREGQPLVWVALTELADWSLPAADRPIIETLLKQAHNTQQAS